MAIFTDCAKQKGFLAGWLNLHKLKSTHGQYYAVGSDGSGVTVGEAFGLNRCAWEKMDEILAADEAQNPT
ncbi:MAG: hypothetical protein AAGF53_12810 [Pseudomonadota bacterium]